jgi:hypothetical protein
MRIQEINAIQTNIRKNEIKDYKDGNEVFEDEDNDEYQNYQ